ncbi:hypothetical protein JOD82_005494 [Paenibacillus sp. 1182]|uniref:hypothetical protein n=1 Tax=Paenibacillus sp. 1182 TaxID=2806565 RepID=UPI001AE4CE43|nr:hypothetical protein [Paenibacillus sp. 1182]MBP1312349.1 hypothetical protein [Paenibacillus sp. 1182]
MASNTPNLSLYMKDPVADGNDFFDVETMMNDNWEKIDGFAGGMDEVKERLNTISRQGVTLQPGVQIINTSKSALFQLSGLTGRMMVNLLGRMGSCESVGLWSSNTTIAVDTANKTSGASSFKLTLGSVPATASASFLTTPGKKYIAVGDVKNGNTSKVAISINGIAGAAGNEVTSASAFAPSVVRFAATDFFHIVTITGTGASGNTFNMDSVRVYEVSDADYAAAASYTPAQAAAKWPYVDSVMPVRNPYVIRYGENLLPSFYEWVLHANAVVLGPNKLQLKATTGNQASSVALPCVPGMSYKISGTIPLGTYVRVSFYDANGTFISDLFNTSITTPNNCYRMGIELQNNNAEGATGTFVFENIMLNIGSTAKPFKPREDSMLALQTDLYADPVTGANADTVFERDGQYFKSKSWNGLTLDGNQAWAYKDTKAGNKQVTLPLPNPKTDSERVVKYDGKLIAHAYPWTDADQSFLAADGLYLSIPVADSGWADGYQPDQNDIKAYFYGYKAYDANTITPAQAQAATTATWNGTGTKYWVQRVGAPNFTQSAPQQAYAGYTPYQLVYQLATPTVEPIVSEGQLAFNEGDNQVEVGTGIVLRESVGPKLHTNGFYYINANAVSGSNTVNTPSRIINIFANNKNDTSSWANYTNSSSNGITSELNPSKFNAAASYSVTYLMATPSPVVPFTGSYAANEKTLLADLVDGMQQTTSRVSVLENKKADKDNPAWLTPTLLNGWTNHDVTLSQISYLKDSAGYVHIKGIAKPGAMNTNVFQLPAGYRPSRTMVAGVAANTDSGHDVLGRVNIGSNGNVAILAVVGITITNTGWVSLDSLPPFLAEQ